RTGPRRRGGGLGGRGLGRPAGAGCRAGPPGGREPSGGAGGGAALLRRSLPPGNRPLARDLPQAGATRLVARACLAADGGRTPPGAAGGVTATRKGRRGSIHLSQLPPRSGAQIPLEIQSRLVEEHPVRRLGTPRTWRGRRCTGRLRRGATSVAL